MAKDEKKVEVTTEENVVEILKQRETPTEEIAKAAAEKIAADRKEKVTEELIVSIKKSSFTREKMLLSVRKTNADLKVKKEYLKKLSELDENLKGGKVSVSEYKDQLQELYKTSQKSINENEHEYSKQINVLNGQYPEANWDYRFDNKII